MDDCQRNWGSKTEIENSGAQRDGLAGAGYSANLEAKYIEKMGRWLEINKRY